MFLLLAACRRSVVERHDTGAPPLPETVQPSGPAGPDASFYDATLQTSPAVPTAGEPVRVSLTFRTASGETVPELAEIQGSRVHLIAVARDLSWYEHLHAPPASDNAFDFELRFPREDEYVLYTYFKPANSAQQIVQHHVRVGQWESTPTPLQPSLMARAIGRYTIQLRTSPETVRAGEWATLTFQVSRDGQPVRDLDPRALGHLVIIGEGGETFAYSHSAHGEAAGGVRAIAHLPAAPPDVKPHTHAGEQVGPEVVFHTRFDQPGMYKLWAEFVAGSEQVRADFVMSVR